jgi:hypothetical protein
MVREIGSQQDKVPREDIMASESPIWTRRRFMIISAAGIVALPLLGNLTDPMPEANASEGQDAVRETDGVNNNPKCKGCQVCTIFYSNCLVLNNRVCWCETT